jgi:hypothetical protein
MIVGVVHTYPMQVTKPAVTHDVFPEETNEQQRVAAHRKMQASQPASVRKAGQKQTRDDT